jgi:hypothetical protein
MLEEQISRDGGLSGADYSVLVPPVGGTRRRAARAGARP